MNGAPQPLNARLSGIAWRLWKLIVGSIMISTSIALLGAIGSVYLKNYTLITLGYLLFAIVWLPPGIRLLVSGVRVRKEEHLPKWCMILTAIFGGLIALNAVVMAVLGIGLGWLNR